MAFFFLCVNIYYRKIHNRKKGIAIKYYYYIYGFHVESDVEIEGALVASPEIKTDVYIVKDTMPIEIEKRISEHPEKKNPYAMKADGIWFRIDEVADYLVEIGNHIIVTPFPKCNKQKLATYLLGSAFGYYMALNGIVAIHGGAVALQDQGIIITGESGAGKSTIATGLLKKNGIFVADDVCALSWKEKKPWINLAYPQQKLCRDAAINLGYDLNELIYIDEERDKYARRLQDGFLRNGISLNYIFELQISQQAEQIECISLQGYEKLQAVINNIFRGESVIGIWGIKPEYMKQCVQVTEEIPVYRIYRPAGKDTTEQVLDEIIRIIERR